MANKVNPGPFLETLKATVVESAINTATEVEIPTPSSKTEELVMLVHGIDFQFNAPEVIDGVRTTIEACINDQPGQGLTRINDGSNFETAIIDLSAGVDEGTLSEYLRGDQTLIKRINYDQPRVYARSSMFLVVQSGNQTVVTRARARVRYTLERVNKDALFKALTD